MHFTDRQTSNTANKSRSATYRRQMSGLRQTYRLSNDPEIAMTAFRLASEHRQRVPAWVTNALIAQTRSEFGVPSDRDAQFIADQLGVDVNAYSAERDRVALLMSWLGIVAICDGLEKRTGRRPTPRDLLALPNAFDDLYRG